MILMLFWLGSECNSCLIPGTFELESVTLSDRDTYIIILSWKELGKAKERKREKKNVSVWTVRKQEKKRKENQVKGKKEHIYIEREEKVADERKT